MEEFINFFLTTYEVSYSEPLDIHTGVQCEEHIQFLSFSIWFLIWQNILRVYFRYPFLDEMD